MTFTIAFSHALEAGDRLMIACEGDGAYPIILDGRFRVFRVSVDESPKLLLLMRATQHSDSRVDAEFLGGVGGELVAARNPNPTHSARERPEVSHTGCLSSCGSANSVGTWRT